MINERKLYGNRLLLSKDIYNFSSIAKFKTDFFKADPFILHTKKLMKDLRRYMKKEFNEKWLTKNLEYIKLSKHESATLCAFSPYRYFNYSFKYAGIVSERPLKLLFLAEELSLIGLARSFAMPYIHARVTTPRTKAVCDTMDYVNGRYHIECPILEPKFTIEFNGTYMPPSKYFYICSKKDNWLLKKFNETELHQQVFAGRKHHFYNLHIGTCSSFEPLDGISFWIYRNDIWHFATLNCYFGFTFQNVTKKCLGQKRVLMIGDSHIMYRKQALEAHQLMNATLIRSSVPAHTLAQLRSSFNKFKNQSNLVIVLNTGHWAFHHLDTSTYVSDMIGIFREIQYLKLSNPSAHIIWIESSAVSFNTYHVRGKINVVIGAMNDWVNYNMRKLGIDIVPAFDISLPMQEHTKDGAHYLELLEEEVRSNRGKVSVGGAISSVLILKICPS